MKFGNLLLSQQEPEWAPFYLNYRGLQLLIKRAVRARQQESTIPLEREYAGAIEVNEESAPLYQQLMGHVDLGEWASDGEEHDFWIGLVSEIHKINMFYQERVDDHHQQLDKIEKQIGMLKRARGIRRARARRRLRKALIEEYRAAQMLRNYCILNRTAIYKITKKYDKKCGRATMKTTLHFVETMDFTKRESLEETVVRIENTYIKGFKHGDRRKGMNDLRNHGIKKRRSPSGATFLIGLFTGMDVIMLAVILYGLFTATCTQAELPSNFGLRVPCPFSDFPHFVAVWLMYRGLALLVLMSNLVGVNTWGWRRNRINYIFIFEHDLKSTISYQRHLSLDGLFGALWFFSVFLYVAQSRGWISLFFPAQYHPLILYGVCTIIFLWPLFKFTMPKTRHWLAWTTVRVVTAPYYRVKFKDFWLGDQFTSLVVVLFDLFTVTCFYPVDSWRDTNICTSGLVPKYARPLLAFWPALWRFLQTLRRYNTTGDTKHAWNAGKYAAIHSFMGHGATLALWIFFIVIAAIYTSYWDIIHDFGLGDKQHKFLRERRSYPSWAYYFAAVTDVLLRFASLLTVSPDVLGVTFATDMYLTIFAVLEVIRRFQWNFFRVENEQMTNEGRFRATLEVPLPFDAESDAEDDEDEQEESVLDAIKKHKDEDDLHAIGHAPAKEYTEDFPDDVLAPQESSQADRFMEEDYYQ